MSRIGKTPIQIPATVMISVVDRVVTVKGPKGQMDYAMPVAIETTIDGQICSVTTKKTDKKYMALHGLVRAMIANMVKSVTVGWTKTLELSGVGYRAAVNGVDLVLTVGFSHTVTIVPPKGIAFSIVEGKIVVSGIYKGKGIKYLGEHIRRKAGKSAKAIGGAGAGGAK
jgi:large subunit ribosomal protein L6